MPFCLPRLSEREEAEEKARLEKEEKEREYNERLAKLNEMDRKRREREKELEEKANASALRGREFDGPDRYRDGDRWGPRDERSELIQLKCSPLSYQILSERSVSRIESTIINVKGRIFTSRVLSFAFHVTVLGQK